MKKLKTFEAYSSSIVDKLLDKINDDGIDSLTDDERDILNKNGVMPDYKEDDDDESLFHKSDLSDMAESDNLKGVSKDWLKRRDKARELYDFPTDPRKITKHIQDVLEYISDKKNAPIFKEKVTKYLLNNVEHINKDNDNDFLNQVTNYLKEFLKHY